MYKALESLVKVGAATKLTAGIGQSSARHDAHRNLHYHFRSLRKGTVHDLPTRFDPELITKLDPRLADYLKQHGFQVMGYHLELLGYERPDRDPDARSAEGPSIAQTTAYTAVAPPQTPAATES
jgi:Fe2+ or Zn2+ uptake regulation protein